MRIKGFDKDLRCNGMQYEIGKEYDTLAKNITKDDLCSDSVFHYCDSLENVNDFYTCIPFYENRFCEVEVLGEEVTDGKKYGTNHIKIVREIVGDELKELVKMDEKHLNTGPFNNGWSNTGHSNNGNFNSGDKNNGLFNSGRYNRGNSNSGDYNNGDRNTGFSNQGDMNCGSYNNGFFNTGMSNRGNSNSGESNIGDGNVGIGNLGDGNIGDFNVSDINTGVFCTHPEKDTIRLFNKKSNITLKEWRNSTPYHICSKLDLSESILWRNMTDEEKHAHPNARIRGFYCKELTYKQAWNNLWKSLTNAEKNAIKAIPNFDADIFEEITGIKIDL